MLHMTRVNDISLVNAPPPLFDLPIDSWTPEVDATMKHQAVTALEQGRVLMLPNLPFLFSAEEEGYLRPDCVDPKGKSVKYSLPSDTIWGVVGNTADTAVLRLMLKRYAESARALVSALFPGYLEALTIGNTSFRPVAVEGRAQSRRQDDSLLHIDAFPSRPALGNRLLRMFTNVGAAPRVWRIGETFEEVAAHYLPNISAPFPGKAELMNAIGLTKRKRSAYDHYMLRMHDRMKCDKRYQEEVRQHMVEFPPGSSWIVFTDQVSHAAMSGQHALEQTFTLPVHTMHDQEASPLRILEGLKGWRLV